MIKRTPLFEIHKKLGAKIVDFAGFEMPLQYTGVVDEHLAVRNQVGIFDVSHMGEIWIKGSKALDLIQYITTNDASRLVNGKAQYSCLPNGKGGIVDDILVYKYDDQKYFLVVNASNTDKVWNWINDNNHVGAELENSSDRIAQIAVQGPFALKTLQKITSMNIEDLKSFNFTQTEVAGIKDVIVSNTGYTGSNGFEIYAYNSDIVDLWNAIISAGAEFQIKPCGLAARDTLRLEKGYSLYGHEIDDTTSPIESGLGWIVKINKNAEFIDKNLYVEQINNGVKRKLVGFEMIERGIPRQGYTIVDSLGKETGFVTSGTMSPSLNKPIGLGYVNTENAKIDSKIEIVIRNKSIKAKVVSLPFL